MALPTEIAADLTRFLPIAVPAAFLAGLVDSIGGGGLRNTGGVRGGVRRRVLNAGAHPTRQSARVFCSARQQNKEHALWHSSNCTSTLPT
jgi:hypothetical protein